MNYYYGSYSEGLRGLIVAENAKQASQIIGVSEAEFSQDWEAFPATTFTGVFKPLKLYTKSKFGQFQDWREGVTI